MKLLNLLVLLLCAASVIAIAAAAGSISATADAVVLQQTLLSGDDTTARGLTVTSGATYDNNLFWSTEYRIGEDAPPVTDFTFHARKRYLSSVRSPEVIQLSTEMAMGIDFTSVLERTGLTLGEAEARNFNIDTDAGSFRTLATDPALGIAAAYNALYMDAPLGKEVTATVKLSDYYDYYPIGLSLQLPGIFWTNNDVSIFGEYLTGTEAYAVSRFRAYFRIPVLEEEAVEIHLTRPATGSGMQWGSSESGEDRFDLDTLSAATDTDVYFTFNTRTAHKNRIIDTSQIAGGYGIYRLPYREGTSTEDVGVDADALEMVIPLTPGLRIEGLYLNAAGDRLLLITHPEDAAGETCVRIEVFDIPSYALLQSFEYRGDSFSHLKICDGYTLAVMFSSLAVFTEDDGIYTEVFSVPLAADADGTPASIRSDHVTAFDGERLAVARNLNSPYYAGQSLCGYEVYVYDADGAACHLRVDSSLDTGIRRWSYSQYDLQPTALSLHWTE